jgi:alpha-tubulin suppressor-like RCC1 family protein
MDTKIELFPKHLPSVCFIGYISTGKHHSLAISTDRVKDRKLQLFTWGSGWYGQTGQGHWRNTVAPELVVINDNSSPPKFVMASCGAKHCIGLDTNGEIWCWGAKNSIGLSNNGGDK